MASTSSSSNSRPTVLVTGGCGYIGNHTLVLLLEQGYNCVVVDNLSNSSAVSLDRVAEIVKLSAEERAERLVFYEIDICDEAAFRAVFEKQATPFHSCIHFAGLKAVGESTKIPLKYYQNNLNGTFVLLELLNEFDCHSLVFSSSATVYGDPASCPIPETATVGTGITNAYGRTKYMIEEILRDYYHSHTLQAADSKEKKNDWSMVVLRYFNPVGSHPSGLIGEDPNGPPNNLSPYIAQVAVGRREYLTVFGNDYSTPDGTGVRDYLHVMDLAQGHLSAIEYMVKKEQEKKDAATDATAETGGIYTFNLGTGNGISVLEMVKAMQDACGHEIAYKIGPRRPGDIAVCYADASLAAKEMNWTATRTLTDMARDLWAWQSKNPNGFVVVDDSSK